MAMSTLQKLAVSTDAAVVRRPLPLRLVGSSWKDSATNEGSFLVVCKPCAMPMRSEDHHYRLLQSPHRYHVPHRWDVSDSFMNRVHDNMHPAATPYHVPFGANVAGYDEARGNDSVDFLSRGLEVVVRTQEDAAFVATCAQLGLLSCTYHVLVHVPQCVHSATMEQRRLHEAERSSLQSSFRNPYVCEHLVRSAERERREAAVAVEFQPGCSDLSAVWNLGLISPCGTLANSGKMVCRVDTGEHADTSKLSPPSLASTKRLRDLFVPVPPQRCAATSCASTACCLCAKRDGVWSDGAVPPAMQRLCVSAARSGSDRTAAATLRQAGRTRSGLSRSVSMDFRLLNVSLRNSLALYEVTTHTASERDVLAVFGHHNLFVVGDAAYNPTLYSVSRFIREQWCTAQRPRGTSAADVPRMKRLPPDVAVSQSLLFPPPTCDERRMLRAESAALVSSLLTTRRSSIPESRSRLEMAYMEPWLSGFGFGLSRTKLTLPKAGSNINAMIVQEITTRHQLGKPPLEPQTLRNRMEFTVYRSCPSVPEGFLEFLQAQRHPTPRLISASTPAAAADVSDTGTHMPSCGAAEEERGVLYCDQCDEGGHTLSTCNRVASCIALRSSTSSAPSTGLAGVNDDLPTTLAELKVYLAAQDFGGGGGDAGVVVVPNAISERSAFSWKRHAEASTPHLHRKSVLRCSHCSGRHRLSECPALGDAPARGTPHMPHDGNTAECSAKLPPADRLFCIRCGARGHLYAECSTAPPSASGAPSAKSIAAKALRCPICAVPKSLALHEPEACSRRFEPPAGFSPSGVCQHV